MRNDTHIQFRLSIDEKERIRRLAHADGKRLSPWIRKRLLEDPVIKPDNEDFVMQTPNRAWITCGIFSVSLNHTHEGLIIDVYRDGEEDAGSIGTLGFLTNDY